MMLNLVETICLMQLNNYMFNIKNIKAAKVRQRKTKRIMIEILKVHWRLKNIRLLSN